MKWTFFHFFWVGIGAGIGDTRRRRGKALMWSMSRRRSCGVAPVVAKTQSNRLKRQSPCPAGCPLMTGGSGVARRRRDMRHDGRVSTNRSRAATCSDCVNQRGRPVGNDDWTRSTTQALGLEPCLRPQEDRRGLETHSVPVLSPTSDWRLQEFIWLALIARVEWNPWKP